MLKFYWLINQKGKNHNNINIKFPFIVGFSKNFIYKIYLTPTVAFIRSKRGLLVAKNGYTKEAVDVARNAQIKILLTDIPNLIDQITQQIDRIIISKQPRIEIIGESAEIIQIEQDGTKRTHIRNAKRVII